MIVRCLQNLDQSSPDIFFWNRLGPRYGERRVNCFLFPQISPSRRTMNAFDRNINLDALFKFSQMYVCTSDLLPMGAALLRRVRLPPADLIPPRCTWRRSTPAWRRACSWRRLAPTRMSSCASSRYSEQRPLARPQRAFLQVALLMMMRV